MRLRSRCPRGGRTRGRYPRSSRSARGAGCGSSQRRSGNCRRPRRGSKSRQPSASERKPGRQPRVPSRADGRSAAASPSIQGFPAVPSSSLIVTGTRRSAKKNPQSPTGPQKGASRHRNARACLQRETRCEPWRVVNNMQIERMHLGRCTSARQVRDGQGRPGRAIRGGGGNPALMDDTQFSVQSAAAGIGPAPGDGQASRGARQQRMARDVRKASPHYFSDSTPRLLLLRSGAFPSADGRIDTRAGRYCRSRSPRGTSSRALTARVPRRVDPAHSRFEGSRGRAALGPCESGLLGMRAPGLMSGGRREAASGQRAGSASVGGRAETPKQPASLTTGDDSGAGPVGLSCGRTDDPRRGALKRRGFLAP